MRRKFAVMLAGTLLWAQNGVSAQVVAPSSLLQSSEPSQPTTQTTSVTYSGSASLGDPGVAGGNIVPSVLPSQATITPEMTAIGEVVTYAGSSVLDIATSGGAIDIANSLVNSGTLYVVSSDSQYTSGILNVAGTLYNQVGGTITTVLPEGGLAGYSSLVSNLNLVLNATTVLNAGSISSAGNLTVNASTIVNALPAGVVAPIPIMQAAGNLNLVSTDIANAGTISAMQNLNILTQTAQNLLVNNVSGTLQAINGSINVGSVDLAGKFNTSLLGGNLLSQVLTVNSGDGLVDIIADNITGLINVNAGELHLQANTPELSIGQLNLSGDPIVRNDEGDIFIRPDQDSTFSVNGHLELIAARNIISESQIITTGTGSSLVWIAGNDIDLSVTSVLNTVGSGGNGGVIVLQAGNDIVLNPEGIVSSDGSFTIMDAGNSLTVGNIDAAGGIILSSGGALVANSLKSTGVAGAGGFIDVKSNQNGLVGEPFAIGQVDPMQPFLHGIKGSAQASGALNIGFFSVIEGGSGGILVNSPDNILVSTAPGGLEADVVLDARAGSITIGPGTLSSSASGFAGVFLNALNSIILDDTTLSANSGFAGIIATSSGELVTNGSGVITANGAAGSTNQVFVMGPGALAISTSLDLETRVDTLTVDIDATPGVAGSLSLSGPGTLAVNAGAGNGGGQIGFRADQLDISNGGLTANANATTSGSGGAVTLFATSLTNTSSQPISISANGAGSGSGGSITIFTPGETADLVIGATAGGLLLNANAGTGGDGGQIFVTAGHSLTASGSGLSTDAGSNGEGGRVILDTTQDATGPIVVTGAIDVSGDGTGKGGRIRIRGTDVELANATLIADAGATGTISGSIVGISAVNNIDIIDSTISITNGNPSDLGLVSHVELIAGGSITVSNSTIDTSAHADDASGGNVLVATAQVGTGDVSFSGSITADGVGTKSGGHVQLLGDTTTITGRVTADGGAGGAAGTLLVEASNEIRVGDSMTSSTISAKHGDPGAALDPNASVLLQGNNGIILTNTEVNSSAIGEDGNGGTIALLTAGDLTLTTGSAILSHGTGNGQGGFVFGQAGGSTTMTNASIVANGDSGDGGTIVIQAGRNLTIASSHITANGYGSDGFGGLVQLDSGIAAIGSTNVNSSTIAANAPVGLGFGFVSLHSLSGSLSLLNSTVSANGSDFSGEILGQAAADVLLDGTAVIATSSDGLPGTVQLDAGLGGLGRLTIDGGSVVGQLNATATSAAISQPEFDAILLIGTLTTTGGDISITVGTDATLKFSDDSEVLAQAGLFGAGNMDVTAGRIVYKETCCTIRVDNDYHATSTDPNQDQLITGRIEGRNIEVETRGGADILSGGGELVAERITFKTQAGNIGTDDEPIFTTASSELKATSDSGTIIHINNDGDVSLLQSGGASNFRLEVQGSLTVRENLTSTDNIDLFATDSVIVGSGSLIPVSIQAGSNIDIQARDGDVAVGGSIRIEPENPFAPGNINIEAPQGRIRAGGLLARFSMIRAPGFVNLAAASGIGEIQQIPGVLVEIPIETDAAQLFAASQSGNVVIHNRGPVAVRSIVAPGGQFRLSNDIGTTRSFIDSNLADVDLLSVEAQTTNVRTVANNGNIRITGFITGATGTPALDVTLNAHGTGDIIGTLPLPQIIASAVTLQSGSGNISGEITIGPDGSFTPIPLVISTNTLRITTGISTGSGGAIESPGIAVVANANPGPFTLEDSIAGLGLLVGSINNLRVDGNISSGAIVGLTNVFGDIEISDRSTIFSLGLGSNPFGGISISSANLLKVHSGASIIATQGNILLTAGTGIVLGDLGNSKNTSVTAIASAAGVGNVLIVTGSGTGDLSLATTSDNFLVFGPVLWGPNEVVLNGSGNSALAINRLIILDAANGAPIVLNGNVHISTLGVSSEGNGASQFAPGRSSPDHPHFGNLVPPGPPIFNEPPGWHNNPGLTGSDSPGQQLKDQKSNNQTLKKTQNSSEQNSPYQAVSFTSIVPSALTRHRLIRQATTRTCTLWTVDRPSFLTDGSGDLYVQSGGAILEIEEDTTVFLGHVRVFAKKGTVLDLSLDSESVVIRNYHDDGSPVIVECSEGFRIPLQPGHEVSLSDRIGKDGIGRRSVREIVQNGNRLQTAEFSPITALQAEGNVRSLWQLSPNHKIVKKILKTAAALSIATSAHGPFTFKD